MPLVTDSRRKKHATLEKLWPGALILDVTSKSPEPWVKFSPFYPHGNIPIPGCTETAQSVEGLWQGLKVFENEGIDPHKWEITNLKGIKRGGRKRGRVLGHQVGPSTTDLLDYLQARIQIYLPTYLWVLENCLQSECASLKEQAEARTVVLLDYETNGDINDLSRPLSHATLICRYCEGNWPTVD